MALVIFRIIWHGWYSKPDSKGKASFCTLRAYTMQGIIALVGAILFTYLSLRHF